MVKFNISTDDLRIILASTEFTTPAKDYTPELEYVKVVVNASKTLVLEEDAYRIDVLSTDRYTLFHSKVYSLPETAGMPIDNSITDATFHLPPAFFDAVKAVLKEKPLYVTVVLDADTWEITSVSSEFRGFINNSLKFPGTDNLFRLFKDDTKELHPVAVALSAQNLARINKAETLAKVTKPSVTRSWTMGTTEPDRESPGPVTLVSSWARILIMPVSQYNSVLFMDYSTVE